VIAVNRKKPIKKNYFAFLTKLSSPWLQRVIISITVFAIIVFGVNGFANETESAEIFGLLILVSLGLTFLFTLFFVVEKITGISCLRGVEWVGCITLDLIDWVVINIQRWRGVDIKKNNRRIPQQRVNNPVSKNKYQYKEPQVNISNTENTDVEAPYLGKGFSTQAEDKILYSFVPSVTEDKQADTLANQAMVGENKAEPTPTPIEQPIIEDKVSHTLSSHPDVDISKDLESPALDKVEPNSEWTDEVNHAPDRVEDRVNSEPESLIDEELHSELVIDPLDEELKCLFSAQKNELIDKPETEITEIADEEDFPVDEINTHLPIISSVEAQDENEKPAHSTVNLQHLFSSEQSNSLEEPELPDESSLVTHSNALSNLEGTDLQPSSLLEQAEKTTATIISSLFVDKFPKKVIEPSVQAYQLPTLDLLQEHQQSIRAYSSEDLEEMSRSVERVLNDYKVSVEVMGAYPGPIITCFELALAPGIKVSRISGLAKDLARALLVTSVRVVEIIEGTPYVGLEIPNKERELVSFREILSSEQFQMAKSPLTLALGKDVSGKTVVSDLGKMPHLLVAGTTGSGKSVAINTMILSLLYKATAEQVRLIMIDPKMLELSVYEGIPHLLTPVVTDMKEAQNALRWAVAEMERRYKLMSKVGVRNLAGFNQKINDAAEHGESIRDPLFQLTAPLAEGESFPVLSTLPHIVIVIDELADMMMIVGKKVEELIARLAQKARAAGIHLILATQRPSVDVLTGLIKANVPTRMSFQVSSKIDSRTILDQGGAEALLGNGDMLFLPSGTSIPIRAHGAFVDDPEVHAVVDYLKAQGEANYLPEILHEEPIENSANLEVQADETDVLYGEAVDFVMETGKASISSVQRRFKVGYNRAARMVDQMEEEGIVSEPEGNGSRRVLNRE